MNRVLHAHCLAASGTPAIPIPPSRRAGSNARRHEGGRTNCAKAREALQRPMEQDHAHDAWFATLLDLDAIPDDVPRLRSVVATAARGVVALAAASAGDVTTDRPWRFTPRLRLHASEALLLLDVDAIARAFPASAVSAAAALIADVGHRQPEEVDGARDTAPSKRILRHFPAYAGAKVTSGPVIAADVGPPRIRAARPHVDGGLSTSESRCRA